MIAFSHGLQGKTEIPFFLGDCEAADLGQVTAAFGRDAIHEVE